MTKLPWTWTWKTLISNTTNIHLSVMRDVGVPLVFLGNWLSLNKCCQYQGINGLISTAQYLSFVQPQFLFSDELDFVQTCHFVATYQPPQQGCRTSMRQTQIKKSDVRLNNASCSHHWSDDRINWLCPDEWLCSAYGEPWLGLSLKWNHFSLAAFIKSGCSCRSNCPFF